MQKRMTDLRTAGVSRMKARRDGGLGRGRGGGFCLEWPFRVVSRAVGIGVGIGEREKERGGVEETYVDRVPIIEPQLGRMYLSTGGGWLRLSSLR